MRNSGFQLAARFAEGAARGRQAGSFQRFGDDVAVITESSDVQYAQHNGIGADEMARWQLQWTAPASAKGSVVFHLVGNAGSDDASAFGDFIYSIKIMVPPVSTNN